jgi:1,4-dihydroxy-2-naphthoate octaprenyltransferase
MMTNKPAPDLLKTSRLQAWWMAIRPHTLPAAVAPVIVAWSITIQQGAFEFLPALAVVACALLLQITSNLVNDVVDFRKGADSARRQGFQRVTQSGLLSSRQVWTGTIVVIILTVLLGLYLVWLRGWPVLVMGSLAIGFALAYTAGPYPLAYHGLGEIFVLIFFGFAAVSGTVYVIMGSVPPFSWAASLMMGALITAILVVNNIRDVESDREAGRKNFPVVFGLEAACWEYRSLLALPYLLLAATGWISRELAWLLPLLSAPFAVQLMIDIRKETGPALNPVLARTARLALLFGLLLAGGIILA